MSGSEVVPAPAERSEPETDEGAIGALLVQAGKLGAQDVDTILRAQRQDGLRFGAAGMALGLLCQADVDYALSRQFDYTYLRRGESKVSDEVVAAYEPFSPQVEALRALRAELMLRWFDGDPARKALAVVSVVDRHRPAQRAPACTLQPRQPRRAVRDARRARRSRGDPAHP
jgi:hypothetical protein